VGRDTAQHAITTDKNPDSGHVGGPGPSSQNRDHARTSNKSNQSKNAGSKAD
jgi:hypothetical protein